jgi:hypothetical protein
MLPALAEVSDMEARLGHPITEPDEIIRAQTLLDDASALIRFEANQTWMDTTQEPPVLGPVPDYILTLTVRAAMRGWYNPAEIESTQLGAVSVRYGTAWLTNSERQQLALLNRGQGLQGITLKPGFGFDGGTSGWVPVDNAENLHTPDADWFPIGLWP